MPFDLPDRHLVDIAETAANLTAVISIDELSFGYVNRYAMDYFGVDEQSIASFEKDTLKRILHPDDYQEIKAVVKKLGNTQKTRAFPVKFRVGENESGQWRWFQAFIKPYQNHWESNTKWVVITGYECTELETTRRKFREQTELLEKILDTSPVAITRVNRHGRLTFVNTAAEKVLGIEKLEMGHRAYDDMRWEITDFTNRPIPPEELPFSIVKRTGRANYGYRHIIIRPDGKKVKLSINAAPLYDSSGEFDGIVASLEDITVRERIQEALRFSERRFRSVVESSPLGIHIYQIDEEDNLYFIDSNRAADTLLGLDNRSLMGKRMEEAFPCLASTEAPDRYREVARLGTIWEVEKIELVERKIPVFFELHAFQIDSCTVGVMFADVTRRFEHEEQLRIAKEEAEAANRAKNDFLAVMSHEMRTPLNPIMGLASLMLSNCTDKEEKTYLKTIIESARRLMDQIQDVLDFSRIEQGQIDIQESEINLWELSRKAVDLIKLQSRGNVIDLEKYTRKGFSGGFTREEIFLGDQDYINQIILNLLTNACKFTHDGRIVLRYGIQSSDEKSKVVRFEVEDTGIGIDSRHLDRLFNPFTQVDSVESRKVGGIGLGLAICKRLVEAMDGAIGVKSKPGRGSLFWFTIPLKVGSTSPDQEKGHSSQLPVGTEGTLTVLLVEDNPANQQVMMALLESLNCRSVLAVNGHESLEKLKEEKFDLLLLDIGMPDMDGFEVAERIRLSHEKWANIPIIAVSAHVSEKTREQCRNSGMNDFLAKPVFLDGLRETLGKYRGK